MLIMVCCLYTVIRKNIISKCCVLWLFTKTYTSSGGVISVGALRIIPLSTGFGVGIKPLPTKSGVCISGSTGSF